MEIDLKYLDDISKNYANRRKNLEDEEAEDLARILVKYLKMLMNSNKHYAIKTPIGIFTKSFDPELFDKVDIPSSNEEKLNEKLFLNEKLRIGKFRNPYTYDELELAKENTNNHPIKN